MARCIRRSRSCEVSSVSRLLRSQRFRAGAARVLMDAGLVLGGALVLAAVSMLVGRDGGLAYDTRAYYLAGRSIINGTTLYSQASVSDLGDRKSVV